MWYNASELLAGMACRRTIFLKDNKLKSFRSQLVGLAQKSRPDLAAQWWTNYTNTFLPLGPGVPCTCQATHLAPERHPVTQEGKRPGGQSQKVTTVTFTQNPSDRQICVRNFTVLTLSICFILMSLRQVVTKFGPLILEVRLLNMANAATCVAAARPTNQAGRRF